MVVLGTHEKRRAAGSPGGPPLDRAVRRYSGQPGVVVIFLFLTLVRIDTTALAFSPSKSAAAAALRSGRRYQITSWPFEALKVSGGQKPGTGSR